MYHLVEGIELINFFSQYFNKENSRKFGDMKIGEGNIVGTEWQHDVLSLFCCLSVYYFNPNANAGNALNFSSQVSSYLAFCYLV